MLNIKDIDSIHQKLDNGEEVYLYYVAHNVELREELRDEHIYKSKSDFRPIKIQITDINNAYFELLDFENNPDDYYEETEEEYYSSGKHFVGDFHSYPAYEKHIHYYTVNNKYKNISESRIPSIIYGTRRKIYKRDGTFVMQNDPSPIVLNYTNAPSYYGYTTRETIEKINNGELNWKYIKYNIPVNVDGIDYSYATSNWYILDIKNFPRVEKPLINQNEFSAYFLDLNEAFEYVYQLRA